MHIVYLFLIMSIEKLLWHNGYWQSNIHKIRGQLCIPELLKVFKTIIKYSGMSICVHNLDAYNTYPIDGIIRLDNWQICQSLSYQAINMDTLNICYMNSLLVMKRKHVLCKMQTGEYYSCRKIFNLDWIYLIYWDIMCVCVSRSIWS